MPTTWPSMRANPHTMFIAQSGNTSKKSPSSTISAMTSFMSYARFDESGMRSMMPVARPLGVVGRREVRRILEVVRRQERQQVAHLLDARLLVVGDERRDARLRRVDHRAAELFLRDLFAGDGLHDVGTGDEHVRRCPSP